MFDFGTKHNLFIPQSVMVHGVMWRNIAYLEIQHRSVPGLRNVVRADVTAGVLITAYCLQ
jgi:hypothetical protein